MKYRQIVYEKHQEIRVIKFNRPKVMNCIGPVTHNELVHAWNKFRVDKKAKVAIITGVGEKAFCAGGDLKNSPVSDNTAEIAAHNRGERAGYLGPTRWTDIYKPIIAAINGLAYAAGLEWACFADIRIAEEHATFGVTCRRWNVGLADGGTQRLSRIIGMGQAMDLIITGKVIDAREAERIGLVNQVVPKGKSLQVALEKARFICTLLQPAIHTDEEAAVRGFGRPLDEGLRLEAECFNRSIFHPETEEGLRQFIERDHPDLKNGQANLTPSLKID